MLSRFLFAALCAVWALVPEPAVAGAVSISIPEPASLALFGTVIGGIAWLKFRRRK